MKYVSRDDFPEDEDIGRVIRSASSSENHTDSNDEALADIVEETEYSNEQENGLGFNGETTNS